MCSEASKSLAILAGGMASRMNGVYKPLLKVCGKTIIERIIESMNSFVNTVYVIVHSRQQESILAEHVPDLNYRIVVDQLEFRSPVTGMYSATTVINEGLLLFSPADTPFLTSQPYKRLIGRICLHDGAVPVWPNGYVEPLISVYKVKSLKKALITAINSRNFRARAPLDYLNVAKIPVREVFSNPEIETFNINTLEDYRRANEICKKLGNF